MADDDVQRFLRNEERARELVTTLEALVEEVDSYRGAQAELRTAGAGVGDAARALGGLASQAAQVVHALQEIGTPEILARLSALTSDITGVGVTVREGAQGIENQVKVLRGEVQHCNRIAEQTNSDVKELGARTESGIGSVSRRLAEVQEAVGERVDTVGKEVKKNAQALSSHYQDLSRQLKVLRSWVWGLGAIVVFTFALVAWLVAK